MIYDLALLATAILLFLYAYKDPIRIRINEVCFHLFLFLYNRLPLLGKLKFSMFTFIFIMQNKNKTLEEAQEILRLNWDSKRRTIDLTKK